MAAQEGEVVGPRICLTTMARESISLQTHTGIVQCMMAGQLAYHLCVAAGPYLDAGRNKAIGNALNLKADDGTLAWDWHLFVDSDIEFTTEHVATLFAPTLHPDYDPTAYPVLGGVYVNPFDDGGVPGEEAPGPDGGCFGPVAYEWVERDDLMGELYGIPTYTFRRLARSALETRPPVNEFWNPEGDVTEVDALGTGFLAIHHTLLTEMYETYGEPLPWFEEPVHLGVHYGEDMGFALRCTDLGYPVLAHRGCTPRHHKTTILV